MALRIALSIVLLTITEVRAEPPLRIMTFSQPPLVEIRDDGTPKGIAVDVVRRLMASADMDYQLKVRPAKRALLSAIQEANTCVFPVDRSQEREVSLRWVGPVSISRHAFYSTPDEPFDLRSVEDARPYRIGSYLGSGVGEHLDGLGYQVHLANRSELGLKMLHRDRVDLWIADTRSAPLIAEQLNIPLGEPELVFFTTLRSMGCHANMPEPLLRHLNRALNRLYDNGVLEDMLQLDL